MPPVSRIARQALGCAGALPRPADGRAPARERDPHPARAAQARSQGRPAADPRAAARAARVSRDREGLRHAAGGPQVRPREGEQDPHAVPDLAEQDDRRPVSSASAPSSSRCCVARRSALASPRGQGLRHHRPLRGRQGHADPRPARARARARAVGLGHDARAAAGRGGRRRLPLPDRRTSSTRGVAAGDFVEHASYSGHRYGTLRSELERAAASAGVPVVLEIEVQGARQVRDAMPEAVQVFIAPPSLEALRTRLVGRGHRRFGPGRRAPARSPSDELAAQREFGTSSSTTGSSRPPRSWSESCAACSARRRRPSGRAGLRIARYSRYPPTKD